MKLGARPACQFAAVVGLLLSVSAGAAELDSRVKEAVFPVYPDIARTAGVSGTVELTAFVDGTGTTVTDILKSSSKLLDEAALAAARKWKLNLGPGEQVTLTFRFTSLPSCSIPARAEIYSPPFAVEVFASKSLPTVLDGEQVTCPHVTTVGGSSQ